MGLFAGIWLIVLGALGAADIIIAKKPDAKELIAKMAPYQGWFGAVSAIWGVWIIISAVLNLGWLTTWPITWALYLGTGVVCAGLGLLFGIGVLKTFIKNEQAQAKMDETVAKVMPIRSKLGIAGIGIGLGSIIVGFLHI